MIARKYVMTKIEAGDYLLPSNDGVTIWRITSYVEDGSAGVPDGSLFWQTAKYRGRLQDDAEGLLDWSNWETWDTAHRTRADAIQAALRDSMPSSLERPDASESHSSPTSGHSSECGAEPPPQAGSGFRGARSTHEVAA